jgi:methoxymalonate biosynthesis acyl carrier protein
VIEQAPGIGDLEGYRSQIRSFIATAFKGRSLEDDEDIFATGFVNSLFAMELVTMIEGTFGITIESDDLDLDNFRTVTRVAEFVSRKVEGQSRSARTP